MASSSSPTLSLFWQNMLLEYCAKFRTTPVWEVFSDKRGGRTAWTSKVEAFGQIYSARYYYDGPFVNNAKEDAAEVALQKLHVIESAVQASIPMYGAFTV